MKTQVPPTSVGGPSFEPFESGFSARFFESSRQGIHVSARCRPYLAHRDVCGVCSCVSLETTTFTLISKAISKNILYIVYVDISIYLGV
jgi:hypothetical protein